MMGQIELDFRQGREITQKPNHSEIVPDLGQVAVNQNLPTLRSLAAGLFSW